jgi:hypothetical protein
LNVNQEQVRKQQQQIKDLTAVVREQLHQIQTLTESLGEMVWCEKEGEKEGDRGVKKYRH